ncbi:ParA family protein [Haladaptatus pallidirubidus]|nr:ParA family protein [Haladaptatus pallidirubidus]
MNSYNSLELNSCSESNADMSTRIAVSCQMGGSGKTTTSINLAGALGNYNKDFEVLLVDTDPQGTATEGTGFTDVYHSEDVSLYDVLTDIDEQQKVNDLILSHEEFDVLPSHELMFGVERELQSSPKTEERLDGVLDALERSYDYVILDTPPHLGPLTNNALVTADGLVVPAKPVRRSIRALETLFEQVGIIEKHFSSIDRLGMLVNDIQYPVDGDTQEMLDWFTRFEDGLGVYQIRNRVAIKRAWNNGVSIFGHEEECDMEEVYDEFATDIVAGTRQEMIIDE